MRESISSRLRVRWLKSLFYATCSLSATPLVGLHHEGLQEPSSSEKLRTSLSSQVGGGPKALFSIKKEPVPYFLDPLFFSAYPCRASTECVDHDRLFADLLYAPLSIQGMAHFKALDPIVLQRPIAIQMLASLPDTAFIKKESISYLLDPLLISYASFGRAFVAFVNQAIVSAEPKGPKLPPKPIVIEPIAFRPFPVIFEVSALPSIPKIQPKQVIVKLKKAKSLPVVKARTSNPIYQATLQPQPKPVALKPALESPSPPIVLKAHTSQPIYQSTLQNIHKPVVLEKPVEESSAAEASPPALVSASPETLTPLQSRSVDASFISSEKESAKEPKQALAAPIPLPNLSLDSFFEKEIPKGTATALQVEEPAQGAYPLYEKDPKAFFDKALIAQEARVPAADRAAQGHLINFRNAPMSDYIRFVASLTGRNFIYREEDVQFFVSVVSKEPTSIENVVSALLQELRIHGLALFQQDNNFIIYPALGPLSPAVLLSPDGPNPELGTRIFQMRYVHAHSVANIMSRILSEQAIVQVVAESNSLLITDFTTNIERASKIIEVIDTLSAAYDMGQYVAVNNRIEEIVPLAEQILDPLSGGGNPPIFVVQSSTNSAFVIGSGDLVTQAFAVLDRLDGREGGTAIFDHTTLLQLGAQRRPSVTPGGALPYAPSAAGGIQTGAAESARIAGAQAAAARAAAGAVGGGLQEAGATGRARELPRAPEEELEHQGDVLINTPEGETVARGTQWERHPTELLPAGPTNGKPSPLLPARKRTKFYIYKLDYRRGDQLVAALLSIAESLSYDEEQNRVLLDAINSVQWIEASNSIIITGTYEAIMKVKDLIQELDTPLKQVYLEMLILDTSLSDSITFSVDTLDRLNGVNLSFAQGFISGPQGTQFATVNPTVANLVGNVDASPLAAIQGFNLGIIGRHIFHNSTSFSSIAALVRALHTETTIDVVLNPKIVVEDNFPASIFVGQNTAFQTQSIANNNGNIITNNVEYRDVGTSLKVTPQIGNGNIITLIIDQEVSSIVSTTGGGNAGGTQAVSIPVAQTTNKATTVTKVHVPDGYFVVLSGMLRDEKQRSRSQMPCVGGIPIIGALFSSKADTLAKRNYLIFIRPKIVENEVYLEETRRNQDIWDVKNKRRPRWKYEADEALDYLNLPRFNEPNDWVCTPFGSLGPCQSCGSCSGYGSCSSCGSCGSCSDCGYCGCCECD